MKKTISKNVSCETLAQNGNKGEKVQGDFKHVGEKEENVSRETLSYFS